MIAFLAMQVRLGNTTLDRIPTRYRAEVEAILEPEVES